LAEDLVVIGNSFCLLLDCLFMSLYLLSEFVNGCGYELLGVFECLVGRYCVYFFLKNSDVSLVQLHLNCIFYRVNLLLKLLISTVGAVQISLYLPK